MALGMVCLRTSEITHSGIGDGMVEDFWDGIVGDTRDGMVGEISDGTFASGTSNSAGNSGNMEQLGEEEDGFLQEALHIKSGSSRIMLRT